jgi:GT2 family glycosyltransferase
MSTRSEDSATLQEVLAELRQIRRHVTRGEEELWDAVDELREIVVRGLGGSGTHWMAGGDGDGKRLRPAEYRRLKRRLRRFGTEALPEGVRVAVVSRGDEELLDLPGVMAEHYPRNLRGGYAGYYPADGTGAIAHLEWVRAAGADYVLFPATATWWLTSFPRLARHLDERYRVAAQEEGVGVLYELARDGRSGGNGGATLERHLDLWERAGVSPALLDWNTGLELAARLPGRIVFSPPEEGSHLPYMDGSVEIVALLDDDPERLAEARRVASRTVALFPSQTPPGVEREAHLPRLEQLAGPAPESPSVSVVIPTYNGIAHLEPCLRAVGATLPARFKGEVVVVDDGSGPETAQALDRLAACHSWLRVVRNTTNSGFITSCNRGAEAATGDYLVFLNDDTVPLPGWLDALLGTFAQYPDAGAVGGRLVYPDGSLQEAGAVIFRDGSGANLGRGDYQVDASIYRHVRRVDYCSGALLATPRPLFRDLGGFDTRYRPAFYEDTDYCFRTRAEGRGVYYQPGSTVVHMEGATSGTDTATGVKRHQARNRLVFRKRWASLLKDFPDPPVRYTNLTWIRLALAGGDR